ncbi:MAG: cytochrome c oxidase assembly factor Coa1 family protein [Pseudoalteromonas sp.]
MEEQHYISGEGKNSTIPPQIKGWNWGACLLNWIWGVGNNTYIALLVFIPFVNLVMFFILGIKGNEWAWRNNKWQSVEHFQRIQKMWRNTGIILFVVILSLLFVGVFSIAGSALKGEAFDQSVAIVSKNEQVIELVGQPIEVDFFVTGDMQTSGSQGDIALHYSISGPKGDADVYVEAYKDHTWKIYSLYAYSKQNNKEINLLRSAQ